MEKVYKCENCGNIMVFDVKTQSLKCKSCGNEKKIENNESKIVEHSVNSKAARSMNDPAPDVDSKENVAMQCKGCGSWIEIEKNQTATKCPYCGSSYVLSDRQEERIVPDGVIPFMVDKNRAKDIFEGWVNKRWLAPSQLKRSYERGSLQGIYMPYWTFDANVYATYSAKGGRDRKVKEERNGQEVEKTVTDWYPTNGEVENFFDDVVIRASKALDSSKVKGIEPFNTTKSLKSYSSKYISGYLAESYTIPMTDAKKTANGIMEEKMRSLAREDVLKRFDKVDDLKVRSTYSDETYKHVLLPVYSMAYNYQGKKYNVVINGETGKISGSYPYSKLKIGLIIGIIVAIIASLFIAKGCSNGKQPDKNKTEAVSDGYYMEISEDEMNHDIDYDIIYNYDLENL